ncbi:hypothetical protein FGSG_13822, partial [Fusarium graminearum PH-1]|uniref:hypothetical protein n=1 Tax=Gibberella zeae (strain ATCC MYA-4620 / CBS 123657 / FGSC 9075 / NRRL 31084 / PH-1) TaxID=229533 RepID=UPI00021F1771
DDNWRASNYTARSVYLARREYILESGELDTDGPTTQQRQNIFFANEHYVILALDRLPSMVNEFNTIRRHAVEIIKSTDPMSSERAIRFGYLGDQAIDFSELRRKCCEAVYAAFTAADSACDDLGNPEENNAPDEPGMKTEETSAPKGRAEDKDVPRRGSHCCSVALNIAARVLEASTAREMAQNSLSGAHLDDLILIIETHKPPTQSQPWEADMPEKPGYHHVYALLGCLMATAYVRHCFAIETMYLDRAISNLDIAVLKMPETPFKKFRQDLREVRNEVQRLQVFFQRIEMEDDPAIDSFLCAVCLDLKPTVGFHDTEYPYHRMEFGRICQKATMRCRSCAILRDSTASMYPLFGMSWPDIQGLNYSNRSVGTVAPWDIIGIGTRIQHDVTSPEAWDMIRGWIGDCINNHEDCKAASEDRPFPTCVVAVGDDETEPHLFIPNSDDHGRYIALSHCWGDVMPLKTTKACFAEFCQSIDFARFPRTFQDAIIVCRKLNIKYLWIDSLCIIQDDEHDWAVESPKMCDVYQNAYLTIAAAAAHNSSKGLFHSRPFSAQTTFTTVSKNDDKVEEVEIFARPWNSQGHWIDNIGDGPWCRNHNPLEKRAWTLQEHVLSRRILRFAAHELVWQCREVHLCECRPGSHLSKESLRLINMDAMVAGTKPSYMARVMNPLVVWLEII